MVPINELSRQDCPIPAPRTSLRGRLTKHDSASTIWRLGKSAHVADLQLIFASTLLVMAIGPIFVVVYEICFNLNGTVHNIVPIKADGLISAIWGSGLVVLAWTYQKGSARLGIVDLFSCEITTICRITTITRAAQHYIELYDHELPQQTIIFSSQENYMPVFDKNSKDLELLEARVVEHVTEFYTYLKALRDYLRFLSSIECPQRETSRIRAGLCNVLYMLFLMLESARHAIDQLIEFEPEHAQNTVTILLSELVAFRKLHEIFTKDHNTSDGTDARLERLILRENEYRDIVPQLYARIHDIEHKRDTQKWEKAEALTGELNLRYYETFGIWIDESRKLPVGNGDGAAIPSIGDVAVAGASAA